MRPPLDGPAPLGYTSPVSDDRLKPEDEVARDLLRFIDASPTPYHCVDEAARRLQAAGFTRLSEQDEWSLADGDACFTTRGDGSLVAFRLGDAAPAEVGFRAMGAHTDSPGLRLKPTPAKAKSGYLALDVEVYGGVLLATWADRDLSIAGRVFVDEGGRLVSRRLRLEGPLCRIPNVAIHLNRKVNDEGLRLDKHQDLSPILATWDTEDDPAEAVMRLVAEAAGCEADAIRGHDLCLHDVQPSTFSGLGGELIHAPRLDNQAMCHAGLEALLAAGETTGPIPVVALFDHEEVGSQSARGAGSPLLGDVLARIDAARPGRGGLRRAIARSYLVSADMAHAVHPNRPDLHDGVHLPRLNGGPVVKVNANQRYATDAETGALFRDLCRRSEVPYQDFVMRQDLPCGSTIGPISAAGLGIRTVDVGNPMLSMHSIRELGGAKDPAAMTTVLTAFLAGDGG